MYKFYVRWLFTEKLNACMVNLTQVQTTAIVSAFCVHLPTAGYMETGGQRWKWIGSTRSSFAHFIWLIGSCATQNLEIHNMECNDVSHAYFCIKSFALYAFKSLHIGKLKFNLCWIRHFDFTNVNSAFRKVNVKLDGWDRPRVLLAQEFMWPLRKSLLTHMTWIVFWVRPR